MLGTTFHHVHDDTGFFEQALQEYREATGDYSKFPDLHLEAQQVILDRAQRLKETGWQLDCMIK